MTDPPKTPARPLSPIVALALTAVLFACALYANLSFAVRDPARYRFFPPFKAYVDANQNRHLGAEYLNIAEAMRAGEGFANPFGVPTGPTAWMPPVLPVLLAGLLWVGNGDKDVVMAFVILGQVVALVATGLLVLALARRTTSRLGAGVVACLFLGGVLLNFHLWFQFTHDYWLILLAVDGLLVGACFCEPLRGRRRAFGWGLFGGLCALINPIVALCWGALTLVLAGRQRAWASFAVAALASVLVVTPWVVRNYLVFGRLIPVKSNAAYELYQSQCLQPDGLLQARTFGTHPYVRPNEARKEYQRLGEMDFLDRKGELFRKAVRNDPADFLDRVASRFLGALLWYVPFDRANAPRRPWVLWLDRLTHPLPFLALLLLAFSSAWRPLHWTQWAVIAVFFLYLMPYVVVSYYERYAMPLLGVKVLLVVWGLDRLLELGCAARGNETLEYAEAAD